MFEQREEDQIRAWHADLPHETRLTTVVTAHPAGETVASLVEAFRTLAPRVRMTVERGSAEGPPAILVGRRLRYLAAPHGTELGPFLEAVQRFGADASARDTGCDPASGRTPADVRMYVSPHCPHCPVATREVLRLLDFEPDVTLTIVDAELFPDLAANDRVRSVPTVLVGRHYRATGTVHTDEIRLALRGEIPDAAAIHRLLDGGDASAIAAMIMESGEVFPAVLDRLAHETMSLRLGAMAALERVIEAAPDVARAVEPGIWDRLASAGPQASGDLIYVLGEAGSTASVSKLEALLDTASSDDLREAIVDALARIAERSRT